MVWMYHIFNYSPFEGHLGSVQFGAVRNKAAMNPNGGFHFFWDKCLKVKLLCYVVNWFLVLEEIVELFSRVAVPFYIPTSMCECNG